MIYCIGALSQCSCEAQTMRKVLPLLAIAALPVAFQAPKVGHGRPPRAAAWVATSPKPAPGSNRLPVVVPALFGLAVRGHVTRRSGETGIKKLSTSFCNLFAIWLAMAAVAALKHPASFTWVKSEYFTGLLGLLMFSVGITTTIDDFRRCLKRPGAVAINFISCYGIMPALAFFLAKAIGAEGAILAGLVLVGSINGGQASNLCTLIAGGDVALSAPSP